MVAPRLADRYRVLGAIGRGASGEVLRAHDDVLGREVAIKVLLLSDGASKDRALREARMLAKITHENVVKVFDVGESAGQAFIVMELVVGTTLRTVLNQGEPVPRNVQLAWLHHLASGLEAVHSRGVVHGDVKPENVVISESGRLTLIDFGLVNAPREPVNRTAVTRTLRTDAPLEMAAPSERRVFGTPEYMAPEQLRGEPFDARADQFAWGVVAFELLAGARPWGTKRGYEIRDLARVLSEDAPELSTYDATIPRPVVEVVSRALRRRASERFASWQDVLVALKAAASVLVSPRGGAAVRQPASTRNVSIVTALLFAMVLLLARDSSQTAPPSGPPKETSLASGNAIAASRHFEAGRQAQRDASKFAALNEFELAQSLDPASARADLWWVICRGYIDDVAEIHFHRAFALRGSLASMDRDFLDALEPRMRRPVDVAESNRRLVKLARDHAASSDAQFVAGKFLFLSGALEEATALFDRTLALDSTYADAYRLRAATKLVAGKTLEAMGDLKACLDAAPSADTCIDHLYELFANEGQCEEAERMVRMLIAHDPSNASGGAAPDNSAFRLTAFGPGIPRHLG